MSTEHASSLDARYRAAHEHPDDNPHLVRERNWLRRYREARDHLAHHGPVSTGLSDWIVNQRRSRSLCDYQFHLLDSIPGWSWEPWADSWTRRYAELRDFRTNHERLPRRRATDPTERSLATWLDNQRRRARGGTLTIDQEEDLEDILGSLV